MPKYEAVVASATFKAHCLHLLDEVAAGGQPLTITKRGRPVARLLPMPASVSLFGALKGQVLSQQDLITPIGDAWDAETGPQA